MKTNTDFKEVDKVISDEIMSEFKRKTHMEECQSCKGTGMAKGVFQKKCENCGGCGFIIYEN